MEGCFFQECMNIFFLLMGQSVYTVCCPEFIPSRNKNNARRLWCLSSTKRSQELILKHASERPLGPSQDSSLWCQTRHGHWTKLVLPTSSILDLCICAQKQTSTAEHFGKLHSMLYWKFNAIMEKSIWFLPLRGYSWGVYVWSCLQLS